MLANEKAAPGGAKNISIGSAISDGFDAYKSQVAYGLGIFALAILIGLAFVVLSSIIGFVVTMIATVVGMNKAAYYVIFQAVNLPLNVFFVGLQSAGMWQCGISLARRTMAKDGFGSTLFSGLHHSAEVIKAFALVWLGVAVLQTLVLGIGFLVNDEMSVWLNAALEGHRPSAPPGPSLVLWFALAMLLAAPVWARTMLALPLITDRGYSGLAALKTSWQITAGSTIKIILLWVFAGFLATVGVFLCFIGVLFTGPMALTMVGNLVDQFLKTLPVAAQPGAAPSQPFPG